MRRPSLPSRRLQYEFALAGLQSRMVDLRPGAVAEIAFVGCYLDDHPAASTAKDAERLTRLVASGWIRPREPTADRGQSNLRLHPAPTGSTARCRRRPIGRRGVPASDATKSATPTALFSRSSTARQRMSWVATRRPRSGGRTDTSYGPASPAGSTASTSASPATLPGSSRRRRISAIRTSCACSRWCEISSTWPARSGQRVFVRDGETWRQLGVPSAFLMTPGDARWIYRLDDGLIEARVWCSSQQAAAFLELRVTAGPPRQFLVTHQLALGANEFDQAGELQVHADEGWIGCLVDPATPAARQLPGLCFAIAAAEPASVAALGSDELLYADGARRGGPYAVIRTRPVRRAGVILLGCLQGDQALPAVVATARQEWAAGRAGARALDAPMRLTGGARSRRGAARRDSAVVCPQRRHPFLGAPRARAVRRRGVGRP